MSNLQYEPDSARKGTNWKYFESGETVFLSYLARIYMEIWISLLYKKYSSQLYMAIDQFFAKTILLLNY